MKSDHTLERRNIETGPISEGLRVVRSGVESGEQVVSTRLQMLQPGLRVEPVPEAAPDAAAEAPETAEAAETPGTKD